LYFNLGGSLADCHYGGTVSIPVRTTWLLCCAT